jgi:hypothetical protein
LGATAVDTASAHAKVTSIILDFLSLDGKAAQETCQVCFISNPLKYQRFLPPDFLPV